MRRAAERATGNLLTDGVLMRRASHGVARVIAAELSRTGGCYGRSVGLVVGAGDNGGDALFAGAELCRRGVRVDAVLLAPDRAHAAGLRAAVEMLVTGALPETAVAGQGAARLLAPAPRPDDEALLSRLEAAGVPVAWGVLTAECEALLDGYRPA